MLRDFCCIREALMDARLERVAQLAESLGIEGMDPSLLATALTHCSYAYDEDVPSYERLEYLGDAVVGLAVADALYRKYTRMPEGELAKRRAVIVSARTLAGHARRLDLGKYLFLGKGEKLTGGRNRPSILADAFEALVGAIYLSRGWEEAKAWVVRELKPTVKSEYPEDTDHKTVLQETLQAQGKGLPEYELLGQKGPDHDRTFTVGVRVGEEILASGVGHSKKEAEREAAREALALMKRVKLHGDLPD